MSLTPTDQQCGDEQPEHDIEENLMTYVITYTQGSGPVEVWIRGCESKAEAERAFWSRAGMKTNPKTKIVNIRSI